MIIRVCVLIGPCCKRIIIITHYKPNSGLIFPGISGRYTGCVYDPKPNIHNNNAVYMIILPYEQKKNAFTKHTFRFFTPISTTRIIFFFLLRIARS